MTTLIPEEEMSVACFIVTLFLFLFVSVLISQKISQITFNHEAWPCEIWLPDNHKV